MNQAMLRIVLSVLLVQSIAAITSTHPASSTSSVIKSERNKKAVNVSQSPITYVQHIAEPGPDSRIIRPKRNKPKKADKQKSLMSNHELLNSLGLGKLPSPSNHHRKRLATQSRHVGRPDDSRVFIVKLPPNPYYYSHSSSFTPSVNEPNSIDDKSKKIPVGFKSNGKPAAIYHWNLPVLSKIISGSNGRSNSKRYKEKKANLRHTDLDIADLIDIKNIPTWSDSSPSMWHENDTIDKTSALALNGISPEGHDDDERAKILKKKSTPNFYAPVKKQKMHKYFPSNGKPKSFYVMKNSNQEKSFHNLID